MSNTCDTGKAAVSDNESRIYTNNMQHNDLVNTLFTVPGKMANVINSLADRFDENSTINQEELDKAIDEVYGKQEEASKLAVKINAMMQASEMTAMEIFKYIKGHEVDISKTYWDRKASNLKTGEIDLEGLPVSTLRNLYKIALSVQEAGTGNDLGHGLIGKLKVQFLIPRKLAYKERTGSIYLMQNNINEYGKRIQNRVEKYMNEMDPIYKGVINLENYIDGKERNGNTQANLERLFTFLLNGRIQYRESTTKTGKFIGQFYIAQNKVIKRDADNKIMKFPDGKVMTEYGNYVPLKNYTPPYGKKGQWNVNISKEGLDLLLGKKVVSNGKLVALKGDAIFEQQVFGTNGKFKRSNKGLVHQFRKIDDKVFKAMQVDFKNSVSNLRNDGILDMLQKLYGLDRKQLSVLFNNPDSKGAESILASLPKAKQEMHAYLNDVFEGYFNITEVEGVDYQPRYQKMHYPSLYTPDTRRDEWERLIERREKGIENLTAQFEALKAKPNKNIEDVSKMQELKTNIESETEALTSNLEVLDIMDNMVEDKVTDTLITPIRHNKYSKQLTGAMNDLYMRTDSAVYRDYLRHIFGQIERNKLTAAMLKAYDTSESQEVKDIVTNLYKLPFNRADIESGFAYWNYDSTALSGYFKKIGISTTPEQVNHYTRMMNNALTAMFLRKPTSAVTNYSAAIQNLIDYGWQRSRRGWNAWRANKKEWDALIKKSGIIDFTDYFSAALVQTAAKTKIEQELAEEINAIQLRYWVKREKGVSQEVAEKEMRESIDEVLKESAALNIAVQEQMENIPKKERVQSRLKDLRQRKRLQVVNDLSNWAITKEIGIRESLRKGPRDKQGQAILASTMNLFNKSGTKRLTKEVMQVYGNASKTLRLTMAQSEQFVRTLSFIIGVHHAQNMNMLPKGNPWDTDKDGKLIWSTKEINMAIEIGKTYSEFSNFELSKGGIGSFSYSGLGPQMGKFKIWSHQKWSRDWDVIANAYTSVVEDFNDKSIKARFGNVGKLFKLMYSQKERTLRASNPEVAQLRAFITWQGALTFLFDLMLLGPIPLRAMLRKTPIVGSIMKNTFGRTLGSGSSDLLSWVFAIPIMMINLAAGGWDEDDADKAWTHYFRRTAFGFLPNWGMDVALSMFGSANEKEKHFQNALSPLTAGWVIPGSRALGEKFTRSIYKDDDDIPAMD
tara:strand:- start:1145 stop:4690 length:3546 start_codon:yes stop_codon:yes gene_type:complete